MSNKKDALAALAKSWRQNRRHFELNVGGATGPALGVETKVPKVPKAECESVSARGRGRDGVESKSVERS